MAVGILYCWHTAANLQKHQQKDETETQIFNLYQQDKEKKHQPTLQTEQRSRGTHQIFLVQNQQQFEEKSYKSHAETQRPRISTPHQNTS